MILRLRNSISARLTVLNLLVSGAAVLLACVALFAYDLKSFRNTMLSDLSTQAEIIGYNAITPLVFGDANSAQQTLAALQASTHIVYAGIYKPGGQFFAGYWRGSASHQQPPAMPSPTETDSWSYRQREFSLQRPIIFNRQTIGIVYIRSDIGALTQRFRDYLVILAGITALSLLAALLISRISQRVISRPIRQLAETARIVTRDKNYRLRAPATSSHDEVAVLIDSFNEMLVEIQQRDTALQESEQQFRTLADSVSHLAWMAHPNGSIFWYNRRWYQYTGTSLEEVAGWGWQKVHDPNVLPEVLRRWKVSIETGRPLEMVSPLRRRDGQFREFLTLAVPLRDSSGKVVRWLGTNTDITEQRRSEEALRQSEKLAATGRLAASIAHEINNPLEAVTNLIYLAQKNPAASGQYLRMADQELERIAEITRHTLGFFRDTSTPVQVDISSLLGEVLNLYDRKIRFKKIQVQTRLDKDLTITAFPGELRQVFSNLVANALEAMAPAGSLAIKASHAIDWSNGLRRGIRVTVLDSGCGIMRDRLAKIFEPFYTTKKDVGTGLGLWLTQSLVQKHHGAIRVRSSTGPARMGTTFSIFLPREQHDGAHQDNPIADNERSATPNDNP